MFLFLKYATRYSAQFIKINNTIYNYGFMPCDFHLFFFNFSHLFLFCLRNFSLLFLSLHNTGQPNQVPTPTGNGNNSSNTNNNGNNTSVAIKQEFKQELCDDIAKVMSPGSTQLPTWDNSQAMSPYNMHDMNSIANGNMMGNNNAVNNPQL